MNYDSLKYPLIGAFAKYSSLKDIINLTSSCKMFRFFATQDHLWERLIIRDFGYYLSISPETFKLHDDLKISVKNNMKLYSIYYQAQNFVKYGMERYYNNEDYSAKLIQPKILSQVFRLKHVVIMRVSGMTRQVNYKSVSKVLFQMTNLKSIVIDYPSECIIPDDIENLQQLKTFDLQCTTNLIVSDNFCKLSNLKSLTFSSCNMKVLPSSLSKLTSLEYLNLASNKITNIDCICSLTNLKYLSFVNNSITHLPDGLSKLTKLRKLQGDHCQILSIGIICSLYNLVDVDFGNNKISNIPDKIGNLTNLEELDLMDNRIKSVPKSFSNLAKLRALFLCKNQIENFSNVCNCTNLEILSLSYNDITFVPKQLINLSKMKELSLSNNLIQEITKAWIIRGRYFPKKSDHGYVGYSSFDISNNDIKDLTPLIVFANYLRNVDHLSVYGNLVPDEQKRLIKVKFKGKFDLFKY